MARVVAEIGGQVVARWRPGGGQVAARVAARVAAGVAPPVCRSSSGGTPHCEEKKVLRYNF